MSSRSITTVDYTITASRRQFLPALGRQAAITSDSIIPRQILNLLPWLGRKLVNVSQGQPEMLGHLGRLDTRREGCPDRVALAAVHWRCCLLGAGALFGSVSPQALQGSGEFLDRSLKIWLGPVSSAGRNSTDKLTGQSG